MTPSLTAIVLAAGHSERFGPENKLLLTLGNRSIIRTVVSLVREAGIEQIVVVTGHEHGLVEEDLRPEMVKFAFNPNYAAGMGSSIVRGIYGAGAGCVEQVTRGAGDNGDEPQIRASTDPDGYLIIPGDMPLIESETLNKILDAWDHKSIVVPVHKGKRGHPVLFGGSFRTELLSIPPDRGARIILTDAAHLVVEIPVDDPFIHHDIDTLPEYERTLALFARTTRDR